MDVTRRTLLKSALALPLAGSLPSLFARAARAAPESDRALVLVQLQGGNDGLNTVVPFEDPAYHRARPTLALRAGQVLPLRDGVGLHGSMGALREVWDAGRLAVVQGVGYPNPNRSHFVSTDIWQTALLEPPARPSGWVGRALDRCCGPDAEMPGLQFGEQPLSLALLGERVFVPAVRDAERFRVRGGEKTAALLSALAESEEGGGERAFVQAAARRAYRTAARLERALSGRAAESDYPQTPLARGLWQVARLVEGGVPARVYAVTLDGFDTHARQKPQHEQLLRSLADALAAFHRDLAARGLLDRILLLTYSEFGRRVEENRSLGTDHGAAAPLLAMGGAVKGGLHGAHPSLEDLDQGDLRFHTDFRRVYAAVLERWIGVDARAVLGGAFEPVAFV
jgi:uncharacterized protein (DUF1501 family)